MTHPDVTIAFYDTKPYDRLSFDETNQSFGFKIDYFESRLTPISAKLAEGHQVVCAFVNDDLGAETIRELQRVGIKLIALRCAGFNNVDLKAACRHTAVVRVPSYSPNAIAEYALSMVMCLNRHLHRAYCRVRENNFSINGFQGIDIHGKTIGVIGTGKIGQIFGRLMQAFNTRVLLYDPYPNQHYADSINGTYVSLEQLYRDSDIISLHCPLTDENRHMINQESIQHMKDGVILINTSRGKLVDTRALINALISGKIGAAGLDVYEEEANYFFEDRSERAIDDDILARLMTIPNVLITSHQAFFTREAMAAIAQTTLTNIQEFIEGQPLTNSVCNECQSSTCPQRPGKP